MAKKSKSNPKGPETANETQQDSNFPFAIVKAALLAIGLPAACLSSQLALQPLYGSTPASLNHTNVKIVAALLSLIIPSGFPGQHERSVLLGLAAWLAYAPYSSYAVGAWSARWRDPVLGSSLTEALILLPVISLGIALLRRWTALSLPFLPGPMSMKTFAAIGIFKFLDISEVWLSKHLPLGSSVTSSNIFFSSAAVLYVVAIISASPSREKKQGNSSFLISGILFCLPIVAAALALSLPPTSSPVLPYVRHSNSSRGAVPPVPASVRVLDRAHSLTGLILVGENVDEQFRFMRADHSLLGGRWIGDRIPPTAHGLGDSIYSAFILQEAARLAERGDVTGQEKALFIGLGVGIAAQAFIALGVNTTVVEIDPVVYKYAREYFGLPEPQAVYLEDARPWVQQHAKASPDDKFDYIIHDCFSGGGVPQHIFTVEFWNELKGVMMPNGVLAVNFAGKIRTDPARAIYLTLQHTFGNCKAFHDHLEAEFDETHSFFNIVFFCMADPKAAVKFREATSDDYLGSYLRRHVLDGLPNRGLEASKVLGTDRDPELLAGATEKWILRDNYNHLAEWEAADAVEHWTVMRDVLPDIFWETY